MVVSDEIGLGLVPLDPLTGPSATPWGSPTSGL